MQAMVSCVSEGTGNVTRALKVAGMWESTLFLWSSDNGGPQYWLGNNYPLRVSIYSTDSWKPWLAAGCLAAWLPACLPGLY